MLTILLSSLFIAAMHIYDCKKVYSKLWLEIESNKLFLDRLKLSLQTKSMC